MRDGNTVSEVAQLMKVTVVSLPMRDGNIFGPDAGQAG